MKKEETDFRKWGDGEYTYGRRQGEERGSTKVEKKNENAILVAEWSRL